MLLPWSKVRTLHQTAASLNLPGAVLCTNKVAPPGPSPIRKWYAPYSCNFNLNKAPFSFFKQGAHRGELKGAKVHSHPICSRGSAALCSSCWILFFRSQRGCTLSVDALPHSMGQTISTIPHCSLHPEHLPDLYIWIAHTLGMGVREGIPTCLTPHTPHEYSTAKHRQCCIYGGSHRSQHFASFQLWPLVYWMFVCIEYIFVL